MATTVTSERIQNMISGNENDYYESISWYLYNKYRHLFDDDDDDDDDDDYGYPDDDDDSENDSEEEEVKFIPTPSDIVNTLKKHEIILDVKCTICEKTFPCLKDYKHYCFSCNNKRIKDKKISLSQKVHPRMWTLFGSFVLSCNCKKCYVGTYRNNVKVPKVPNA